MKWVAQALILTLVSLSGCQTTSGNSESSVPASVTSSAEVTPNAEGELPAGVQLATTEDEVRALMVDFKHDHPAWSETYHADGSIQGFNKTTSRPYSGQWHVEESGGRAVVHYDYAGPQWDTSSLVGVLAFGGGNRIYYVDPDSTEATGWRVKGWATQIAVK